jgi:DNA repair exonuclease SbcCD nuclease subunit
MRGPRVLHLADLHIYLQGPRAEECRRILDWTAANAQEVKPNVITIAGDVFERRSTPQERIYFAEILRALSAAAPVVAIGGNHDDYDDLRLFREEYGWRLAVGIHLEPGVVSVAGVTFALLPWPNLANLVKAGAGESILDRRAAATAGLLDIVRGFRLDPQVSLRTQPSLLVTHLSVTGASMDSGQPVCGGEEIALSADELLESGAAGVALGHIHLRQSMATLDRRPVWYAGAPFRGSFGEAKGTKGGLIWDWDPELNRWSVTPWEVPARSMVLIETAWIPAEEGQEPPDVNLLADHEETIPDADVRIRITFPAEYREAMRAAMAEPIEAVKAVAHAVAVEERATVISRTRCVEITEARTTFDKVQAWAQAVGAEVPADAAEKLGTLEAGVL